MTDVTALLQTEPTTRDRIGEPEPWGRGKRREVTSRWIVGHGFGHDGEPGTIVLDLASYHSTLRKCFTTSLRVSLEVEQAGYTVTTTLIAFGARGECVKVHEAPCARFSAKVMRQHHHTALSIVQGWGLAQCADGIRRGVRSYQEPTKV